MSLEDIRSSLEVIKASLERHDNRFDKLEAKIEKQDYRISLLVEIYDRVKYLETYRRDQFNEIRSISNEIPTNRYRINNSNACFGISRAVCNPTFEREREIVDSTHDDG